MARPALFVFAKAPVAGAVKTRLQPEYTAAQAADIAVVLIRETVALAVANWDGPIYLATTPTTSHPLFTELASRYAITLRTQHGADLGARMHDAIAVGVAWHGAAAVMGCDVAHCPGSVLHDAAESLGRGRAVLGPSMDGGYYLIGLCASHPELFADIAWGSHVVYDTTVARAAVAGIKFKTLMPLRDIDTPNDLRIVARAFPPLARFAL